MLKILTQEYHNVIWQNVFNNPRGRQQESKRKDLNITSMKQKGLYGKRDVDDYRYLASTTGSSTSFSITYILFLTEMQKRQTLVKRFALFKNDITGSEPAFGVADILQ